MRRFQMFAAVLLAVVSAQVFAGKVDTLLKDGNGWLVAQRNSQSAIDKLESSRQDMVVEYRTLLREIEGLDAYNAQVTRQIEKQDIEIQELENSIAQATTVDREILPLMSRMVGALEQFINLDMPFLAKERAERLQFVKDAIERVDVSVAEKFRQVLESYGVELEFGRTIEAYTEIQEIDGQKLEVDILRVGRIGMFYQTLDGRKTGRWDENAGAWEDVPAKFRNPVRNALKVARKLVAPDLFMLPLRTPGDAS